MTERLNSGDLAQIASVVRDLRAYSIHERFSPAMAKMLEKAEVLTVTELTLALECSADEARARLDAAIGVPSTDDWAAGTIEEAPE